MLPTSMEESAAMYRISYDYTSFKQIVPEYVFISLTIHVGPCRYRKHGIAAANPQTRHKNHQTCISQVNPSLPNILCHVNLKCA